MLQHCPALFSYPSEASCGWREVWQRGEDGLGGLHWLATRAAEQHQRCSVPSAIGAGRLHVHGARLTAAYEPSPPSLLSHTVPQERCEVLMGELMGARVGKSAGQAAELFVRCPALANTRHVMPSVARLVAQHHAH